MSSSSTVQTVSDQIAITSAGIVGTRSYRQCQITSSHSRHDGQISDFCVSVKPLPRSGVPQAQA